MKELLGVQLSELAQLRSVQVGDCSVRETRLGPMNNIEAGDREVRKAAAGLRL